MRPCAWDWQAQSLPAVMQTLVRARSLLQGWTVPLSRCQDRHPLVVRLQVCLACAVPVMLLCRRALWTCARAARPVHDQGPPEMKKRSSACAVSLVAHGQPSAAVEHGAGSSVSDSSTAGAGEAATPGADAARTPAVRRYALGELRDRSLPPTRDAATLVYRSRVKRVVMRIRMEAPEVDETADSHAQRLSSVLMAAVHQASALTNGSGTSVDAPGGAPQRIPRCLSFMCAFLDQRDEQQVFAWPH